VSIQNRAAAATMPAAATASASGVEIATSTPPRAGPPITVICRSDENVACARMYEAAGTIEGSSERVTGVPKARAVPMTARIAR